MTNKEKYDAFIAETKKMFDQVAAEEVAASEHEVEAPVDESPSIDEKVDQIHDFLFGEEDEVTEEEVEASLNVVEEVQEEVKDEAKEEEAPVAEESKQEEVKEEKISLEEFKALKEELAALKAGKEEKKEEAEEPAGFTPNPEAKAEKGEAQWGGVSQNKTFVSPQDKVFAALAGK